MEPGDIIRNRVAARSEESIRSKAEQKETEILQFNTSVQKVADAIVATKYAGCSIYEWQGQEFVGIELYNKHYSDYGPNTEGILLHLLIDSGNQYQVIQESSITPEKKEYLYRIDYDGGVNLLEGTQFDPRTDQPSDDNSTMYGTMDYNLERMKKLLEHFERIKQYGPYKGDEAWYRV
jgi:hypothetical protein